ncbi:hypothetical protein GCM10009747_18410 [Agromyces humatus]|uniref:SbsA Ig-like domain-containing protein n=1 Tax=Agromyces humatus TaxID=279573 RepID=A0ABN2KMA2_9MICO
MSDVRRTERDRGVFRRRIVGTIVVLAVVAGGFAFASVMQGPRLEAGQIDAASATRLAGEQLTLTINQPVASIDAEAVEVEPVASVSAAADDRSILITFERPLDYAAEYTVRVPNVVGAYQGTPAMLEYRFETPDEEVYSLLRRSDQGEDDIVQRTSFAHPETEVVFAAPRIQEFARVDDILAVVTVGEQDRNDLFLSQGDQPQPAEVGLPDDASIRELAASTTHPLIGFVLDTPARDGVKQYEATLMTMDLSGAGPAEPQPVLGLDGAALRAAAWAFVPGSTSLIVQAFDKSLFLIDVLGLQPVTPLGVHDEIRGFIAGTSDLVVADPDRGALIDLADGTTATLELASADLADNVYTGRIAMLDESRYLVTLTMVDIEGGRTVRSSMLAEVDAEGELRQVFAPASDTSSVRDYCVSPNGQYVAVAVSGEQSRPDSYSHNPGYTQTMTSIVEIATARTVLSLQGGFSDWCAD